MFRLFVFVLSLSVVACTSVPSTASRLLATDSIAQQHGWVSSDIADENFLLRVYYPEKTDFASTLTIYIEGDGLAWINRSSPSADPTPTDPIALKLALAQPEGNAVYLARPCQYAGAVNCG